MSRTIKRTFKREAEGSALYREQPDPDSEPAIGSLVLSASAVEQLGSQDEITVTIKAAKRGSGTVIIDTPMGPTRYGPGAGR